MIDKFRLQLQLLPRIEGYNLILKEPVNITFNDDKDQINEIAFLHYLFCKENLSSDSTFNQLAGEFDEIEPNEITTQLDKLYEKIPSDKESLNSFISKNLSEINLWHAYSVLKKDEDLSSSFQSFIHTLQDNVMKIAKENHKIQVNSIPSNILSQIKQLISAINYSLNHYAESHEIFGGILKEFINVLTEFQNIISNALNDADYVLYSLNESEFLKYRNQISDFSFFCGYLDKGNDYKLSQSFSELLLLIDSIFSYHNSLPIEPVNPLAVSKAADSCFQSINSIISQEDTTVAVYKAHLIALSGIFEDISIAFKDLICLKPVVTRLIPFLTAIQKNIEPILEQFTFTGFSIEIHNFLVSFYQIIDLLKKLEFDSSMVSHVNTNVILTDDVNVSDQIIKTKELIEASSSNALTEFELSELILLFINPSKETKSTEGAARGSKPEKVTESLEGAKAQLTKLCSINTTDLKNSRTIASFAKLSKKLLNIGKSIDSLKSTNPELNDQYVEIIQSFNVAVFNLIDLNCQPIDTMTPFSCVRSICSLLENSLKMLDYAENTEVDPKDDRKIIKAALKYFDDLSQNFNEPLLIENAPEIEEYQKDLTKIFENNASKYDLSARECYITNTLEFILTLISIITLVTSQMEEKAYELSEVFSDVDLACSSLLKTLETLTLEDQVSASPLSLSVQYIIKLLSNQLEKVTMIRYALGVAIPQQLVRPIIEYRASIDYLPSLVFPFDPDHNSITTESVTRNVSTALNCLSLARWKLGHLKEYYLYDQELKEILKDVSDELIKAQQTDEGDEKLEQTAVSNFKADNKNMLQTVDNIYSILGIFNERTGDEPTDYIDIFKTLIHQVTESWNKDLSKNSSITNSMENARKRLNDAIELLHGDSVKYQVFVNPIEQFGDSYLVPYLAASAARYGGDEFYKTAMDAKGIDFPSGNDKLKKGMEIMNSFINIITISPDEVQKMIAAPMIYYVAAAKLMAYRQYKEFLDLAITFMEARPHELNNICFLLSYHMHKIYEKCAPNTIKSKDSIAEMLRILYMQHANSKLADTYYYTTVFSTLIPKEHAPIFTVLSAPMRECFHCRIQLSTVNFKEAIAYLNGIHPTAGRLSELRSIVDNQPKLETEVGLIVDSSKKKAEGKTKDDEDDIDLHGQEEVVISRNIQVLQPKRINVARTTIIRKITRVNKIEGMIVSKQSPTSISSILDENNDLEMDNHNGRIYQPLITEIPIEEKNVLSEKSWQTLIFPTFSEEDIEINRDPHYKKSWYTKPCVKNNINYEIIDVDVPEFNHIKLLVQNEYNLPKEDKEASECSLKTNLSSELMRKISYSIDEREFNVSPLGEIFENQFVPKDIKKFPSEKDIVAPETVPAALKKLKKAKQGDFVSLIKQDKSTHEELLNSLVFGVSHYLDIITAANVESLCGFLSFFSKEELDENLLPWIYHHFSPKHYPKNFFTTYLQCVSTYMRTVFLERSENNEMVSALLAYPYLIHIATAAALVRCAKKPELRCLSKQKQASSIHDFVNATSFVISCSSHYSICKDINRQLSLFMVAIAPYCDEYAFLMTFDSYLRNLTNNDFIELIGNLEISKVTPAVMNFKCQLTLLRLFAPQKEFVQALSKYNEEIFESVFNNSSFAFEEKDSKSITKFLRSMAEIAIIAESVEGELNDDKVNSNTALIASKIIPYLDIAIHNYDNQIVKEDCSLVEHLLIPFLLVLHSAPRGEIIDHFYRLSSEDKSRFFSCIFSLNMSILTKGGSPDPFETLPNFITREEHIDYLEDKSINTKNVNYTLFSEFTIRFVEFTCRYIREHPLPNEVLDEATICVNSLFNRHQLRDNYQHCLYLLVYFVTVHSNLFFTGEISNLNAFRSIVIHAYELVSYELQVARSSGVTIIVHLMYCDYMYTNAVVISGYYIVETHIKAALEKNLVNRRNQLLLFTNLIIQIDLYANNFSLKKFVRCAEVLIEKLKVLHKCIKEKLFSKQSQQLQYAAMMKLADQFVEIPSIRLFWLEEMKKYNVEKKLLAQAYQSQVRAISLITSVLKGLGKYDEVPYSVENLFSENFYYKADDKVNYEYEIFPKQHAKQKTQEKQESSEHNEGSANKEKSENSSEKVDAIEKSENLNEKVDAIEKSVNSGEKVFVVKNFRGDSVASEDELKLLYYNSPKFSEEYLRKSIFEALQIAFDATLVRQYSQIHSLFSQQIAESGETARVFEDIARPLYFYMFGERAKGTTITMRIYSTTIPRIEDFVAQLLDEKSPLCATKTTKFRINVFDSIVEAENKVNGGRFVIPVESEKVVTFRGESSLFISDYIEPDVDKEASWNETCVKRTFFKTSHPLPSDSIFVNAKKHVVRTITRKALFSARVKFYADFLAISRSATRNFKRSVSIAPLVYSLGSTLIGEKSIASELIQEYRLHVRDPDFIKLAKSFIQDVYETTLLFIDRVRPMLNPQPAIDAYRKIYEAATKTAKNLRVTDYEFTEL